MRWIVPAAVMILALAPRFTFGKPFEIMRPLRRDRRRVPHKISIQPLDEGEIRTICFFLSRPRSARLPCNTLILCDHSALTYLVQAICQKAEAAELVLLWRRVA